jgi:hypothetical protein
MILVDLGEFCGEGLRGGQGGVALVVAVQPVVGTQGREGEVIDIRRQTLRGSLLGSGDRDRLRCRPGCCDPEESSERQRAHRQIGEEPKGSAHALMLAIATAGASGQAGWVLTGRVSGCSRDSTSAGRNSASQTS